MLANDYSYLNQVDFLKKYAAGPKLNQMRFFVGGIRCGKCVRKLEDLSLTTPGLARLQVEMGRNLAHVEVDPAILPFAKLAQIITELGFEPIPLTNDLAFENLQRNEDRAEIIRLGIAGALAMNIMTFSFALYFGSPGEWAVLFSWLSFALYIPVLTYVAAPFYKGALQSLRQNQISIDVPMAIASLAGFVFSTVELLRGKNDIYYDSLAGFLFLILASRFVQKRLQRRLLRPEEINESLQLQRVRRIESHGWSWQTLEKLQVGDRFLVHAPETLPAEAELLSQRAYFSLAWLSGEAKAKTFLRGSVIPAGARLLSGEAQLIARRPLAETSFGEILNEVQRFSLSKNATVQISDRWAQWLLTTVFSIAALFLVLYWHVSPEQAIERSLALIILACPCAMAFGTPLALAVALKRARANGLIVRDASVFEKARTVETVYFDKTGTLTEAELSLIEPTENIPLVYQKIILTLENESLHPIAFAFRTAFKGIEQFPPADKLREAPGKGVSGFVFGRFYELRSGSMEHAVTSLDMSTSTACTLFEDERALFSFHFEARLKTDSSNTLEQLRREGFKVGLLSGDSENVVKDVAERLGFKPDEARGALSPCDKAQVVGQTQNAMMIGDGINDSLAMMRAKVSLSVSGGMEAALKSSDAYLSETGLKGVTALLLISREAYKLIKRNLVISVIYNAIGGTLALLGYVNPLVAALLMPASSGFILLSTAIWSRRK